MDNMAERFTPELREVFLQSAPPEVRNAMHILHDNGRKTKDIHVRIATDTTLSFIALLLMSVTNLQMEVSQYRFERGIEDEDD
jgi:hypothetical protein